MNKENKSIEDFMDTFKCIIFSRHISDSCVDCGKIIWTGNRIMFNRYIKHKCRKKLQASSDADIIFKRWTNQFVSGNVVNYFLSAYQTLTRNGIPGYIDFVAYIDFTQMLRYTLSNIYTHDNWLVNIFSIYKDSMIMDKYKIIQLFDEFDYLCSEYYPFPAEIVELFEDENDEKNSKINYFLSLLVDQDFNETLKNLK